MTSYNLHINEIAEGVFTGGPTQTICDRHGRSRPMLQPWYSSRLGVVANVAEVIVVGGRLHVDPASEGRRLGYG